MINKIDGNVELKNEIFKLKEIVSLEIKDINLEKTAKFLMVLKQVKTSAQNQYYGDCMISELLMMIYLLKQNSIRLFYMIYRSMIENSVRFILDLAADDERSVTKLFKALEELCNSCNEHEIYSFIESQYKKGCDYTHSNLKAHINLFEYYAEIAILDKPDDDGIITLFQTEETYLQRFIDLLILYRPNWFDISFFRANQKLRYLLSDTQYMKYKLMLEQQ